MLIESALNEIINDSSDSIPEELKLPLENQGINFQLQNTPYYLGEEINKVKNISPYENNYFVGQIINKLSTDGFSNNILDNIIEKNNNDKCFEDSFPFLGQTIKLDENEEPKLNIFETRKPKKRGRMKLNNNIRKIHAKTDDDNILIKIQVHFLTFLINVSNDIIAPYIQSKKNNIYFRHINYSDKKNITNMHLSELKNFSIKDILQMQISKKYRECREDNNKLVYNFICEKANKDNTLNWIINFFNMKYLEVFEKYYYADKNKNYFYIQDKKINFSEKTKPFYHLLEKNENNPEIQECFKKISERYLIRLKEPYQRVFFISKDKNKKYPIN